MLASLCLHAPAAWAEDPGAEARTYAQIVHASYRDALSSAITLQSAVTQFLNAPGESTLAAAKSAWVAARAPYSQTEAYRFYEGPIDFANAQTGESGPEARLNAWPLNEAYIDYVEGNPNAGIVQDINVPLTPDALKAGNQQKDEKDVSTGYHAIEFLLWGQDLNPNGPGSRSYTDYVPGKPANDRRREYLRMVTQLLVDDLKTLADAWEPGKQNYAQEFLSLSAKEALSRMLTGAASLAGSEMANERLNNSLISGDQEDEQSCFSDTTSSDFMENLRGVANVYFGQYGNIKGASVSTLVAARDAELDRRVRAQFQLVQKQIDALGNTYDRVLASPKESPLRRNAEALVKSLQGLGDLLKDAGTALGAEVTVVSL